MYRWFFWVTSGTISIQIDQIGNVIRLFNGNIKNDYIVGVVFLSKLLLRLNDTTYQTEKKMKNKIKTFLSYRLFSFRQIAVIRVTTASNICTCVDILM